MFNFINKYFEESTLKDIKFRTVNAVVGVQGAGKTLFLTALAYLYANDRSKKERHLNAVHFMQAGKYVLDNDNIVLANYNLSLQKRGRDLINLPKVEIKDFLEFKKRCAGSSLIICDEAQDEFNARKWQQTDRNASRFCEFARHFDLTIFFSAQDFESIDKTFRGYSKIFYVDNSYAVDINGNKSKKNQFFKNVAIERVEVEFFEFDNYEQYKKFIANKSIFSNIYKKKISIHANLFNMYNHDYLKEIYLKKGC